LPLWPNAPVDAYQRVRDAPGRSHAFNRRWWITPGPACGVIVSQPVIVTGTISQDAMATLNTAPTSVIDAGMGFSQGDNPHRPV